MIRILGAPSESGAKKKPVIHRLLDWERQAIVDAYLAKEKIESIGAEFGVDPSYASILARRKGHETRGRGRPRKNGQLFAPVLVA